MTGSEQNEDPNTYKIVYESTLEQLEKTVNDLIAQAWEADSPGSYMWEIQGEVGFDGKNYYQTLIKRPLR